MGATPQQTQAVVAAAIPMLVAALAKNAKTPGGADALFGALERDHQPNLMDRLGPLAGMLGGSGGLAGLAGAMLGGESKADAAGLGALLSAAAGAMGGQSSEAMPKALRGDKILGHVLGDQQAGATSAVAKASGVDMSTVAALLPVLAPVVMSALGTTKTEKGLDAGGLAGFLASEVSKLGAQPASSSPGFGADDLMKVGGALAQSGLLGKLFG